MFIIDEKSSKVSGSRVLSVNKFVGPTPVNRPRAFTTVFPGDTAETSDGTDVDKDKIAVINRSSIK